MRIRQGHPLSPFMFILMMEGLGRAIGEADREGDIIGVKMNYNA